MTTNVNPKMLLLGCNAVGGSGLLRFYTDPKPVAGESIGSATLLAEVTMASTLGVISDTGTHWRLTFNASTPEDAVLANGTCTWARLVASDDSWICDWDVATSGEFAISNNSLATGGIVSISSGSISVAK